MELYEFECNQCGWAFDEDEAYRDEEGKLECPDCGSNDLKELEDD